MDDVVQRGITVTRDGEHVAAAAGAGVRGPEGRRRARCRRRTKAPMSPAKKVGPRSSESCYSAGLAVSPQPCRSTSPC